MDQASLCVVTADFMSKVMSWMDISWPPGLTSAVPSHPFVPTTKLYFFTTAEGQITDKTDGGIVIQCQCFRNTNISETARFNNYSKSRKLNVILWLVLHSVSPCNLVGSYPFIICLQWSSQVTESTDCRLSIEGTHRPRMSCLLELCTFCIWKSSKSMNLDNARAGPHNSRW